MPKKRRSRQRTLVDHAIGKIISETEYGEIERIPLSQIHSNKWNPRVIFGIESMIKSIRKNGLLTPLEVRKVADGYEVIDGERRLKALKIMYPKMEVPCIVKEASDVEAFDEMVVINRKRKTFDFDEIARSILKRKELFGTQKGGLKCVQKDLGERLGLTQPRISQIGENR